MDTPLIVCRKVSFQVDRKSSFETYNHFIGAYNKLFNRSNLAASVNTHVDVITSIRPVEFICSTETLDRLKYIVESAGTTISIVKTVGGEVRRKFNGVPIRIDEGVRDLYLNISLTLRDTDRLLSLRGLKNEKRRLEANS